MRSVPSRIIPAYAGSTPSPRSSKARCWDHPRIRGEHILLQGDRGAGGGSSPHTRGALHHYGTAFRLTRIIPAYAGSTRRPAWSTGGGTDHPRIRGEHLPGQLSGRDGDGSSPHTRGARRRLEAGWGYRRIIPAYAGSTGIQGPGWRSLRDHPRIRGEHSGLARVDPEGEWIIPAYAGSTRNEAMARTGMKDHPRIRGEHRGGASGTDDIPGSSPHTRGALPKLFETLHLTRIIPAYAGSTCAGSLANSAGRDHPRIRGEHSSPPTPTRRAAGSSPHTRGARRGTGQRLRRRRIIPAYAGSTGSAAPPRAESRDHPRIRGEHRLPPAGGRLVAGSSPHTRGAPLYGAAGEGLAGIIPAYAGSTPPRDARKPNSWDHPRIRGEHRPAKQTGCAWKGSSPHTRGAHHERTIERSVSRIIPAYAGSTSPVAGHRAGGRDHPRIRGEHNGRCTRGFARLGSSPHTRGAPAAVPDVALVAGIIPAYAGSTGSVWPSSTPRRDHPRIRGEHP